MKPNAFTGRGLAGAGAVVLLEAACAFSGCGRKAPPGEMSDFRVRWPAGRTCIYEVRTEQRTESRFFGLPTVRTDEVWQAVEFSFSVDRAADGKGLVAELMLISAEATMSRLVEPDEAGRPTRKQVPARSRHELGSVGGARVKYSLTADGEVEKAEGIPDFLNQVMSDSPYASASLARVFNEKFLKRLEFTGVGILPETPLAVGNDWERRLRTEIPDIGTVVTMITGKYNARKTRKLQPAAYITFSGPITESIADPDAVMMLRIKEGKISGGALYVTTIGLVGEWFQEARVSGVADIRDPMGQGLSIEQSVYYRITVNAVSVEDAKPGGGRLLQNKEVRVKKGAPETGSRKQGRPGKARGA